MSLAQTMVVVAPYRLAAGARIHLNKGCGSRALSVVYLATLTFPLVASARGTCQLPNGYNNDIEITTIAMMNNKT